MMWPLKSKEGKGKSSRIAVVTGANRGIGKEIARQLAKKGIHVILTARDEAKGKSACEEIMQKGMDIEFHRLDVADGLSIQLLVRFINEKHGKLDILVNNAGIYLQDLDGRVDEVSIEIVRKTMDTNCYGPFRLCKALIPLLTKSAGGRIINMSSGMGALKDMGGGSPAYRISKTALNALTVTLASDLQDTPIRVNTMCPGWVKTDMGGSGATRDVEKGAETAVWLATASRVPTGKFFRDRKIISW